MFFSKSKNVVGLDIGTDALDYTPVRPTVSAPDPRDADEAAKLLLEAVGLGEEQLRDPAHPTSGVNRRVQLVNVGKKFSAVGTALPNYRNRS